MMGGLGVCGRSLCCSSHLTEFHPVSIKMAKEQSLSLNPTKISGTCGRLMCCLKYEQDAYEDLLKRIPKAGALVQTPHGTGTIMYVSILEEKVKVKLDNENEPDLQEYRASEVKLIKDVDKASTEPELELEVLKQLEATAITHKRVIPDSYIIQVSTGEASEQLRPFITMTRAFAVPE